MGGNGSYSATYPNADGTLGGIPLAQRLYLDTGDRVNRHKILVRRDNPEHMHLPENSNSASVYLVAKVVGGVIVIEHVRFYEDHRLAHVIDLKFDAAGNVLPYDKTKRHYSHEHDFHLDYGGAEGSTGRKKHDPKNEFPTDVNAVLIRKIEKYNKEKHKWPKDETKKK